MEDEDKKKDFWNSFFCSFVIWLGGEKINTDRRDVNELANNDGNNKR